MTVNYVIEFSRGGVEDTKLETKDTKEVRGQGQRVREQTLSRPRTEMLKDTGASILQKKGRSEIVAYWYLANDFANREGLK